MTSSTIGSIGCAQGYIWDLASLKCILQGKVLGAATTTVASTTVCAPTLTTYLWRGNTNSEQIKILQQFLNLNEGSTLPITGYYGSLTTAAVKDFQQKYASTILSPWGLTVPTGMVYRTTLQTIQNLQCQG